MKQEQQYNCELCSDTGYIPTMEAVYPGEGYMANIGERKCTCQIIDDDDEYNE